MPNLETRRRTQQIIIIALISSLLAVGIVTAVVVSGHHGSTVERINQACAEHGGVQQDIDGVNAVICKDGKAYSY